MAALLNRDREKALKKFVELRDLGPVNVDLGSGLDLLREEARAEYNKAVDAKDPAVARPCLERSLHYLPENFYALYALGTLEAEAGGEEHVNDVKAIALWSRALAAAKEGGVDLSSFALHLNLAQAHYRRHEDDKARALLTEYLAFGKGAYAARCQALLEVLDVKRR
jgi:tetratricopeptide (TPR) repeat protein